MAKKKTFNSPDSQEREYTRYLLSYSKSLQKDVNEILIPEIQGILSMFKSEARVDSWVDRLDSIILELKRRAESLGNSASQKLSQILNSIDKFNERQFRAVVKSQTGLELPPVMPGAPASSILGVNVFRSEPFLKPIADGWISENTALIKSLPVKLYQELDGIIRRGVTNGDSVKSIQNAIRSRFGVSNYRARLIAQDQVLSFNAALTKYRLQSVGVEEYIWMTVNDSRVRPVHEERNGKTYTWAHGAGGEHPGTPIRCRCRAEGIFK